MLRGQQPPPTWHGIRRLGGQRTPATTTTTSLCCCCPRIPWRAVCYFQPCLAVPCRALAWPAHPRPLGATRGGGRGGCCSTYCSAISDGAAPVLLLSDMSPCRHARPVLFPLHCDYAHTGRYVCWRLAARRRAPADHHHHHLTWNAGCIAPSPHRQSVLFSHHGRVAGETRLSAMGCSATQPSAATPGPW